MVGFLSKGECLLKTGSITQETFEGVTNIYLKDNPELKPIYKWVTTSTNGKAGLIAMGTHYDSDCGSWWAVSGQYGDISQTILSP